MCVRSRRPRVAFALRALALFVLVCAANVSPSTAVAKTSLA
jgi:hypothetical protein